MEAEYKKFIKEAYIDPIRSVVVIDDEYPTLDDLLQNPPKIKAVNDNAKEILSFCRGKKWLTDFYDGSGETIAAEHLHQSDLLILDYQLDGKDSTGDKSIKIIQKLADNPHFNIVIIYTQKEDIHEVIKEIKFALLYPDEDLKSPEHQRIKDFFDKDPYSDTDIDTGTRLKKATELVNIDAYLTYRFKKGNLKDIPLFQAVVNNFPEIEGRQFENDELYRYFLCEFQDQEVNKKRFSEKELGLVRCNNDEAGAVNWIRTEKIFITVVSKKIKPSALISNLEEALCNWDPSPNRLIITKIRNEIEESGVILEDQMINDIYTQAAWLEDILKSTEEEREYKIVQLIERQCRGLALGLAEKIHEFSADVVAFDKDVPSNLMKYFGIADKPETRQSLNLHWNYYISNADAHMLYLSTGHVFTVGNEYWVCLSPACDLVPAQEKGWSKRLRPCRPFKAVKIHKHPIKDAGGENDKNKPKPTDGSFLFIKNHQNGNNSEIEQFRFISADNAGPEWEQFFIFDQGRLVRSEDKKNLTFRLSQIVKKKEENSLSIDEKTAHVVACLNYEYALNLLQRLGNHLTRVGLDFKDLRN